MSDKKVWLVTGAGRGLGVDIAKAALAAGHAVVATGRNAEKVTAGARRARRPAGRRRSTSPTRPPPRPPSQAAVERFGRIDVLVNNAGNFYAGFFEELSPEEFRAQIETTLFGPVNVTRAALPVMRAQRSGLVVTISSTAGIARRRVPDRVRRLEVRRRGLDGVAGPGGRAVRHPHDAGRARLLPHRAAHAGVDAVRRALDRRLRRADRADRRAWKSMDGKQGGDPAKLADALVQLAALEEPPLRFAAGADAVSHLRDQGQARCSHRPTPTASCPAPRPRRRLSHERLGE